MKKEKQKMNVVQCVYDEMKKKKEKKMNVVQCV